MLCTLYVSWPEGALAYLLEFEIAIDGLQPHYFPEGVQHLDATKSVQSTLCLISKSILSVHDLIVGICDQILHRER